MLFLAYSCSNYSKKHGLFCFFLFQLAATAKSMLFLFKGAAVNLGFLLQGRRIPTTYLLPLTWLLGLLLVLPYLKFIDYFSLEVSIIDYMFTSIHALRGKESRNFLSLIAKVFNISNFSYLCRDIRILVFWSLASVKVFPCQFRINLTFTHLLMSCQNYTKNLNN